MTLPFSQIDFPCAFSYRKIMINFPTSCPIMKKTFAHYSLNKLRVEHIHTRIHDLSDKNCHTHKDPDKDTGREVPMGTGLGSKQFLNLWTILQTFLKKKAVSCSIHLLRLQNNLTFSLHLRLRENNDYFYNFRSYPEQPSANYFLTKILCTLFSE